MKINRQTAKQFLDAINDYVSNGDIVIEAITPEEAGSLNRKQMNEFLFKLFQKVLQHEAP